MGDLALDLGERALGVELDVAAEEVVGIDAPEDDVEVGDRDGLEAALGPAHTDPRAGRVGPELGPVRVRVDAHERAGPGADRVDADERHVEHEAGDVRGRSDVEPPVGDQRDVEGGAADVGAQDVRELQPLGQRLAADDAADRTGDESRRQLLRLHRDRAPVRGHHPQLEGGVSLLRLLADLLHRCAGGLGGVGLDQRRVEPREIAAQWVQLRSKVNGDRAVHAALGLDLGDDLRRPPLVRGVAVTEQEADADSLDAGVEELGRGFVDVLLAQRQDLGAHDVDSPTDSLHLLARDDRLVVVVGRDVETVGIREAEVGLNPALDPQVVLVAGRDDRADVAPGPREQAVEHRRARVDPGGDPRERLLGARVPLLERVVCRLHEADRLVLGRRLGLADDEAAGAVDDERVGHRPAGVDGKHARVSVSHFSLCGEPRGIGSRSSSNMEEAAYCDRLSSDRINDVRPIE